MSNERDQTKVYKFKVTEPSLESTYDKIYVGEKILCGKYSGGIDTPDGIFMPHEIKIINEGTVINNRVIWLHTEASSHISDGPTLNRMVLKANLKTIARMYSELSVLKSDQDLSENLNLTFSEVLQKYLK